MKYLSDYLEDEQSKLFKKHGAFFAFSNEQFKQGAEENKGELKEGEKWASVGLGMFMPSSHVKTFAKEHEDLVKTCIEQDLAENGRTGVLRRELLNYEIGYSDLTDPNFREGINGYGFTEEEITEEYNKVMREIEW